MTDYGRDESIDVLDSTGTDRSAPRLHLWWAQRSRAAATAALALAADPDGDPTLLPDLTGLNVLDACSGSGRAAALASSAGADAWGVDINPVATLVADLTWRRPRLLAEQRGPWLGLAEELRSAVELMLSFATADSPGIWASEVSEFRLMPSWRCSVCGQSWEPDLTISPRMRKCKGCGARWPQMEPLDVTEYASVGSQRASFNTDEVGLTLRASELGREVLCSQHRVWKLTNGYAATAREAFAAPAIALLCGLLTGYNFVARELVERLPSNRAADVADYLALGLSRVLPALTSFCSMDERGRLRLPTARGIASFPDVPFIAGPMYLKRELRRYAGDVARLVTVPGAVPMYIQQDLTRFKPPKLLDIVVWDPPFFDNIDYDQSAAPFNALLRTMARARGAKWIDTGSLTDKENGWFESYWDDLAAQARNIRQHVKSEGHLSVYWTSRDKSGLDRFLALLQGCGFAPVRVLRLEQRVGEVDAAVRTATGHLIVLRPVTATAVSSSVDAAAVLDLADSDRPTLFVGLAHLLHREWEPEDLKRIPSSYRGTDLERVTDYLADHADLLSLLSELGLRSLRGILVNGGQTRESLADLDVRNLAARVLQSFGFTVPRQPHQSMIANLDVIRRHAAHIQLVRKRERASEIVVTASGAYERFLRLSCMAWCALRRPSDPDGLLGGLLEQAGRRYHGADRLSLGDWAAAWVAVVVGPADEPRIDAALRHARRSMKRAGAVSASDAFINLRNGVVHHKPEFDSMDDGNFVRLIVDRLTRIESAFSILEEQRAFPTMLEPQWEKRDNLGRRLLGARDERGRPVELYTAEAMDLTKPLVWFSQGASQRETDPLLLRDFS
jgi:hypothetical protein